MNEVAIYAGRQQGLQPARLIVFKESNSRLKYLLVSYFEGLKKVQK
jgi:hypothetical protein